jgi:hypothetical protein
LTDQPVAENLSAPFTWSMRLPHRQEPMSVAQGRRILDRFGWTQAVVADACGVSLRTMQRALSDSRTNVPRPIAAMLWTWSRHPESQPPELRRRTRLAGGEQDSSSTNGNE